MTAVQLVESLDTEIPDLSFISDPKLRSIVFDYLSWDKNQKSRKAIKLLVTNKDVEDLDIHLSTRLKFGTAGLRGMMGPGYCNMNDLVIIQTTQGFIRYLESTLTIEDLKLRGVVIGYDGRHNSFRFAELATAAFVNQGYPVRLFSYMCPTPFVPFAVRHYNSCAGIMVTASHNPKEDNGYKVYWENGAQIISPHDKGIQKAIDDNCKPWDNAWEINPSKKKLIIDPLSEVKEAYYHLLCDTSDHLESNAKSLMKITFTPMHGVGQIYMDEAFKRANLPAMFSVPEQKDPDPEFPTVRFPNPEEGKSALNLAISRANETNSTIILANDPDSDRLAVAEKLPTGDWKIFNGNELGALLGWWSLLCYVEKHGRANLSNCYMISSTVSSKILESMAIKEGFNFEETLTGFKWMGNRAVDLIKSGKIILFAFEEAIGFMCGTLVLDKDGIGAGVKMGELANYLNTHDLTLNDQLNKIYEIYGYHVTCNSYFLCYQPEVITKMFIRLRNYETKTEFFDGTSYPKDLLKKRSVIRVRDLTTGFDSGEEDKKAKLPVSKGSHMLTFMLDNGLVVTLRTSGTEPKVKYYTELRASPEQKDWNAVKENLKELVDGVLKEWVQPERWNFIKPPCDHSK